MRTPQPRHLLLASMLVAASPFVQAQAFDAVRLFGVPSGDGQGLAGLALIAGHEYLGSDERKLMDFPILDYQWKSGWFAGTSNGVGYQFASPDNMQYGLRVTADLGRRESASSALAGVGNIDAAAEVGAFFNYFITPEGSSPVRFATAPATTTTAHRSMSAQVMRPSFPRNGVSRWAWPVPM